MIANQYTLGGLIAKAFNPQSIILIMTTKKNSHEDEERILNSLRRNPELKGCFLEMINIAEDPTREQKLKLGDDAEDAVVEVIQKTGRKLLEEWAQRRSEQAAKEVSQKPKHRPHGKKK